MSVETPEWLNTNTLIGFTAERGEAWHYREDLQGDESNHYVGAIPIADVRRRLLGWEALTARVVFEYLDAEGNVIKSVHAPDHKGIGRSDTFEPLGVFKSGYETHQYDEWLLQKVSLLLDDDLQIGSAGLLDNGGICWVSIEVPETMETPSGIKFRPHLVAATSHNGRLSTTYQRCVQLVVCDNTLSAAMSENGERIKVRHSRYSHLKLQDAREALSLVYTTAGDFEAHAEKLTNITISDGDIAAFLSEVAPLVDEKGQPKEGRGLTMAQNKQAALRTMYETDERVTPWAGTAFGVLQLMNTYEHHGKGIRKGNTRAARNMLRAITGGVDKLDSSTIEMLTRVMEGKPQGELLQLAA
jgi:phage/plasmid-like protein (TIGR03299 family)